MSTQVKLTLEQLQEQLRQRIGAIGEPPKPVKVKPVKLKPAPEPEPEPEPEAEPEPAPAREAASDNREVYLLRAAARLREHFHEHHVTVPEFRVSVGYPKGHRGSDRPRGYTVPAENTSDHKSQVFVSPVVENTSDALTILATEMIRVASERDGDFSSRALRVGLTRNVHEDKSAIQYVASGADLRLKLKAIQDELGAYPHAAVIATANDRQSTRQLKVYCTIDGPNAYKVRMSEAWITKLGTPVCPCHGKSMLVETKPEASPEA